MSGPGIVTSMPSWRSRSSFCTSGSVTSTGAGMAAVPNTVRPETLVSSVTVCDAVSALLAAPVLYSVTVPVRRTLWPAWTVGVVLVKTRMPSEVSGSLSPTGSCRKKPLLSTFVTTPWVVTVVPTRGLVAPGPWIAGIDVMPPTSIDSVHEAVWASLLLHSSGTRYEPGATLAATLKVAVAVPPSAEAGTTPVSVMPAGSEAVATTDVTTLSVSLARACAEPAVPALSVTAEHTGTIGAFSGGVPPQVLSAVAALRGVGVPEAKSLPFWSVSVQPAALRSTAVLFVVPGAAAAPSKKLAVP